MSRMKAPKSGVRVRMYRQGQGDCFLMAFPREGGTAGNPVYLLIDCGYMGGSQFDDIEMKDVVDHIAAATGGFIDHVAITHEHADHVNGFNKKHAGQLLFDQITFGHLFLAWTEEDEPFANDLRERHNDQLISLALAEQKIDAMGLNGSEKTQLSQLLEIELGPLPDRLTFVQDIQQDGALGFSTQMALKGRTNKEAIKYLRDRAQSGPEFLRPGQDAFVLDGTEGARVFVLGPPRNEALLESHDPEDHEEFKKGQGFAPSGEAAAFHMAMTSIADNGGASPFANRYRTPEADVFGRAVVPTQRDQEMVAKTQVHNYNSMVYCENDLPIPDQDWRRIDGEWLTTASSLALRMNNEVNNTSLVLAFELPGTGKVLLFTGDAQRGNWFSWKDVTWDRDGQAVSAKDLLGRVVFYKCGHHGSHNATLKGEADSVHPNLNWFAQGAYAGDFVAMIPVHSDWADQSKGWTHPLPSIEEALMKKARGRVLRNDRARVKRPSASSGHGKLTDAEWDAFKHLSIEAKLYKEYIVLDE